MADAPHGPVAYLGNLAVALDQLGNALVGGNAHGTLSARAWEAWCAGRAWGRWARPAIDAVFGAGHCERACKREAVVLTALADAEEAIRTPG